MAYVGPSAIYDESSKSVWCKVVIVIVLQAIDFQMRKLGCCESEITYSARWKVQFGKQAKWWKIDLGDRLGGVVRSRFSSNDLLDGGVRGLCPGWGERCHFVVL